MTVIRSMLVAIAGTVLLSGVAASPAVAQTSTSVAHAPNALGGQVGQRQGVSQVASDVLPYERLQGRVQNRVENRLRNRVDRYYDPQANATSPFAVASDQARAAGRARSRH